MLPSNPNATMTQSPNIQQRPSSLDRKAQSTSVFVLCFALGPFSVLHAQSIGMSQADSSTDSVQAVGGNRSSDAHRGTIEAGKGHCACEAFLMVEDSLVLLGIEQSGPKRSKYPPLAGPSGIEYPFAGDAAPNRISGGAPLVLRLKTCANCSAGHAEMGAAMVESGRKNWRLVRLSGGSDSRVLVARDNGCYSHIDIGMGMGTVPFSMESSAQGEWILRGQALPPGEYALVRFADDDSHPLTMQAHAFGVDPSNNSPASR